MYNEHAARLIQNGYFPVPTAPPGFVPKKAPVRFEPALGRFVLFKNWSSIPTPIMSPQPGAGVGIRLGDEIVAFDYDDDDAALTISEAFDPSPVCKVGQRGWTAFYRIDFEVPSEDFSNGDGRKVFQVLSRGRQTVIPPSIHPDTGSRIGGRMANHSSTRR